jgi:membrane protein YdbS with pleckstrin-like domain
MRVPHAPAPPPGAAPRTFRAAPNYYYFRLIVWLLGHAVFFVTVAPLVLVATVVARKGTVPVPVIVLFWTLAGLSLVYWLLHLTVGYAVMKRGYELRWYMISDRAIRIREGIVTVREKTIALANIQNTAINQGPLQRLLGIADVEVRTAGGGSSDGGKHAKGGQVGEPMHIGYFRGVDNAAEIREIIQAGVRRHRDSGLGDPEEVAHVDPAERLLAETVALRRVLEGVTGNG